MKILSSPSINLNLNRKFVNNGPKLTQLTTDTLSFSAQIPKNLKAELKYISLQEKEDETGSYKLAVSQDPQILDLLKALRSDENVTPKFKHNILLSDPDGKKNTAFISRISSAKGHPEGFDFQVAKAMIDASPNIETTQDQLLTGDTEGKIPLHFADIETAKMLLESSPNDETLQKQITAKDRWKNTPFWQGTEDLQKLILSYCTPEFKRELLTNSDDAIHAFYEGDFFRALSVVDDEEIFLEMLQVRDASDRNLFHLSDPKNTEFFIGQLKNHPDILKKMILQKDSSNKLPMWFGEQKAEKAIKLYDAAPDQETKKAMLLDGVIVLDSQALEEQRKGLFFYLEESPDDETLKKQLDKELDVRGWAGPVKGALSAKQYVTVLQKFKSNEEKKNFLLDSWKEHSKGYRACSYRTGTVSRHIKHEYNIESKSDNFKESSLDPTREALGYIIIEVVSDDTTTNEEALKLIKDYKDIVSKSKGAYLSEIETYLKSLE